MLLLLRRLLLLLLLLPARALVRRRSQRGRLDRRIRGRSQDRDHAFRRVLVEAVLEGRVHKVAAQPVALLLEEKEAVVDRHPRRDGRMGRRLVYYYLLCVECLSKVNFRKLLGYQYYILMRYYIRHHIVNLKYISLNLY